MSFIDRTVYHVSHPLGALPTGKAVGARCHHAVVVMYEINTWVGIALSLIGSIVVAPGAVRQIWKQTRHNAHQMAGKLARFLPSSKSAVVRRQAISTSANVGVGVVTTATGWARSSGTPEEQLDKVWEQIGRLHDTLASLRNEMDTKHSAQRDALASAHQEIADRHHKVVRRLDHAEGKATRINASAPTGDRFGIVLSSGAADFARMPVCLNIAFLILFLALSAAAMSPILRQGRAP